MLLNRITLIKKKVTPKNLGFLGVGVYTHTYTQHPVFLWVQMSNMFETKK